MWKLWFKNKVDINSNKGDTIKNSNVTIQQTQDSSMIKEIYYKMGRLETDIKNIYHRINELKCDVKDIKNIKEENEYDSPFVKRRIH